MYLDKEKLEDVMDPAVDESKLVEMRLAVERERRIDAGMDVANIEDIEKLRGKFKKTRDRGVLQETKCLVKYDEANMTNDEREL